MTPPPPAAAGKLRRPHPLSPTHDLGKFDCGEPALDDWLRRWGLANQASRANRTFVVTPEGSDEAVAYHSLASGSVSHADAIRDLRHAMPDPVPVTVLARLAVHRAWRGHGLGAMAVSAAAASRMPPPEATGAPPPPRPRTPFPAKADGAPAPPRPPPRPPTRRRRAVAGPRSPAGGAPGGPRPAAVPWATRPPRRRRPRPGGQPRRPSRIVRPSAREG